MGGIRLNRNQSDILWKKSNILTGWKRQSDKALIKISNKNNKKINQWSFHTQNTIDK